MVLYKVRLVEVLENGYTILEYFDNPHYPSLFIDVELPFGHPEDCELPGITQVDFFPEVFAALDITSALNSC